MPLFPVCPNAVMCVSHSQKAVKFYLRNPLDKISHFLDTIDSCTKYKYKKISISFGGDKKKRKSVEV